MGLQQMEKNEERIKNLSKKLQKSKEECESKENEIQDLDQTISQILGRKREKLEKMSVESLSSKIERFDVQAIEDPEHEKKYLALQRNASLVLKRKLKEKLGELKNTNDTLGNQVGKMRVEKEQIESLSQMSAALKQNVMDLENK